MLWQVNLASLLTGGSVIEFLLCDRWFDLQWGISGCTPLMRLNKVETAVQWFRKSCAKCLLDFRVIVIQFTIWFLYSKKLMMNIIQMIIETIVNTNNLLMVSISTVDNVINFQVVTGLFYIKVIKVVMISNYSEFNIASSKSF